MIPLLLIIIIIFILFTSALCSMIEAAFFTVPINRVRTWVQENYRFASSLLKIKESMQKPIATIVILNNISNIVGSIIIGSLAGKHYSDVWVGIISGILTFSIILFSEIIPKTLGERYAGKISLIVAKPVLWVTLLFTPILIMMQCLIKPFIKEKPYPTVSEGEIKMLAQLGHRQGVIEKEEEEIIRKALVLNDIKVKEIMTPRMKMIGLEENRLLKDVKDELLEMSFSRIPLYKENLDQITGLLYKSDALTYYCKNKKDIALSKLSKKVLFVPENKPIDKLLEELRITQSHTAIVIDEYGGTAGLVSLEDILEELVGDIVNEGDLDDKYVVITQDEIVAPGFTLLDEVNEFFDSKLDNHRTISKLILDQLNRFPEQFENIECENLLFIVEEVTSKTIEKVRIKRQPTEIDSVEKT